MQVVGVAMFKQIWINWWKKKDKPLVDAQVAEFFYTSVIPFNAIINPGFLKMCKMIKKYEPNYKPSSYHYIREKLLKTCSAKNWWQSARV